MLVRKDADILELTEVIEGNFDVKFFHSLREVVEIFNLSSSFFDLSIKLIIFIFFIFFLFFLFLILFFIFIRRWLLILTVRIGEIVDLAFILRVEIVDPLNNDWFGRLDCVLTLSIDILEKVERGGQWEELAPILKLMSTGHLPEVAEVLDGQSTLDWNSIRRLTAISDDEVLSCILRLSKEHVFIFFLFISNASHLHSVSPDSLTTAIHDTDHIAAFHLCKRAQILFQRVHFSII